MSLQNKNGEQGYHPLRRRQRSPLQGKCLTYNNISDFITDMKSICQSFFEQSNKIVKSALQISPCLLCSDIWVSINASPINTVQYGSYNDSQMLKNYENTKKCLL